METSRAEIINEALTVKRNDWSKNHVKLKFFTYTSGAVAGLHLFSAAMVWPHITMIPLILGALLSGFFALLSFFTRKMLERLEAEFEDLSNRIARLEQNRE